MSDKLCSRCRSMPRAKGQGFCRACGNQYAREYRLQKRLASGRQSGRVNSQPIISEIPDAVQFRLIGDAQGWTVAARYDTGWAPLFQSPDREEALLVLGATFGQDLRS